MKTLLSVMIIVSLLAANCGPSRGGCPSVRNFSGYSNVEQNCTPNEWEVSTERAEMQAKMIEAAKLPIDPHEYQFDIDDNFLYLYQNNRLVKVIKHGSMGELDKALLEDNL